MTLLGYRGFFTIPHSPGRSFRPVTEHVFEQLDSWLGAKGYDCDALLPGMVSRLASGVDGLLLSRDDEFGRSTRVRVMERRSRSCWVTDLTIGVSHAGTAWVWLDVDAPHSTQPSAAYRFTRPWTSVPRLARGLVEVVDAYDGRARLRSSPVHITADLLPQLLDSIADPDRRGLVLVAGSDERLELPLWTEHIASLARETVSLAATYVLDPEATRRLTQWVGERHAVAPWTMRAFQPGVRPGDPLDGRPRRVSFADLSSDHGARRVARRLGWWARSATEHSALPAAATRAAQILDQDTRQALGTELTLGDRSRGQTLRPSYYSPAQVPRQCHSGDAPLGRPQPDVDLAKRLAALTQQVQVLAADRDGLRERLEDEQLAHAETFDEGVLAQEQIRRLRHQLQESDHTNYARPEPPQRTSRPTSYDELLVEIGRLKYLTFTGSAELLLSLEHHDPLFTWGGKIWDVLCSLEDYGRASLEGRCDRDVEGYLRHLPDGCRGYSANRHARDESAHVRGNERLHRARVFSVPEAVSADGEVYMGAHFKIAQSGQVSPRLHYFDDTAGSGLIYVGYIGPHLPTKRTN